MFCVPELIPETGVIIRQYEYIAGQFGEFSCPQAAQAKRG